LKKQANKRTPGYKFFEKQGNKKTSGSGSWGKTRTQRTAGFGSLEEKIGIKEPLVLRCLGPLQGTDGFHERAGWKRTGRSLSFLVKNLRNLRYTTEPVI